VRENLGFTTHVHLIWIVYEPTSMYFSPPESSETERAPQFTTDTYSKQCQSITDSSCLLPAPSEQLSRADVEAYAFKTG